MRVLTIDLETAPSLVYTWSLKDLHVGLNQIVEPGRVICFAAKWHNGKMIFRSEHHHGRTEMIREAHRLLDEADMVIHYNGKRFDVPHLNRLFLEEGLAPPSPYKQIDLWRVGKQFNFISGRLDHLLQQLEIGKKISHEGFDLWKKCLGGEEKAWKRMRRYNIGDTRQTELLYERLLPWIPSHPSPALYDGGEGCSRCGGEVTRRGYATTLVAKYPRFQCKECGGWMRGAKMVGKTELRGA